MIHIAEHRAVKEYFDCTPSRSRLNSALEKQRKTISQCFIVNHIIPPRYICRRHMHKCADKHPYTHTHSRERELGRERQRRRITSYKPGSRWENRDQLQSYCLNLIDTTMKLFRQIGVQGGEWKTDRLGKGGGKSRARQKEEEVGKK